jgi:YHS domain-containing protein
MTKDPVCGMEVNEKKAPATSMYKGEHYNFCGQQCKDKFDQNPERYTASKQNQPRHQAEPQHTR